MLGIIVEVELEVVDRYYLEEEVTYPTWDALFEGWERDVADNRHSSWFWFPDDNLTAAVSPSTDLLVTTRRKLVAASRASDFGQNTQVKVGFVQGEDTAIPGHRRS